MSFVRPPPIAADGLLLPFAPASAFDGAAVQAGMEVVRGHLPALALGPLPAEPPHLGYAATHSRRAEALLRALAPAPALGDAAFVLWACRGGSGTGRLLPAVEPALAKFATSPRWVVGFSDLTALHARLQAHHVMSLHAANLSNLPRWQPEPRAELFALLGPKPPTLTYAGEGLCPVGGPSRATGRLFGGNLTVLASLCGTGHLPSFAGGILLLEDVGEAPYRLDRALAQLIAAGQLTGVRAVVLGQFTNCPPRAAGAPSIGHDVQSAEDARRAAEWLVDTLRPLGIPVLLQVPVGHGDDSRPVLLGGEATLDAAAGTLTVVP